MNINYVHHQTIWIALAVSLFISMTAAKSAPSVQGTASVIDGDTIEIHGQRIRLDAIDAPESSQLCLDAPAIDVTAGKGLHLLSRT